MLLNKQTMQRQQIKLLNKHLIERKEERFYLKRNTL